LIHFYKRYESPPANKIIVENKNLCF